MLLFLINDILDFSKIESGKMDIIPVEYDLEIILNELLVMIRPRAEKKNLSLELIIEPETPAYLYGDEVRIRQIITNILTNAVKYTPKGKVSLRVSGEIIGKNCVKLYISVKDTGMGFGCYRGFWGNYGRQSEKIEVYREKFTAPLANSSGR